MERPKILITNEAGINAAGLHALVNALAKTNLYDVVLCIPDPIDIAYGHSITWEIALVAKRVDFKGANLAYVLSGTTVDCTSLGLSGKLFPFVPDLVISGISKAVSWGYCINYSGKVAGAREAFLHGVPSVSISHNWLFGGECKDEHIEKAAAVCLPIISAILDAIKKNSYPRSCFLNIYLPTDCTKPKGYKLTEQGQRPFKATWIRLDERGKPYSASANVNSPTSLEDHRKFKLDELLPQPCSEIKQDQAESDPAYYYCEKGYITVTPLGALTPPGSGCQSYFKEFLDALY